VTVTSAQASAVAPADRVYVGGTIVTMNSAQPLAEAVAVKDGKILAVGSRSQIEALRGPSTIAQDLGGKTLLPGFIDGHGHLSAVGLQAVAANLLPPPDGPNDSIAALQKSLREWAATSNVPEQYGIMFGFGYDDSQLKEQRHPTREELDAISTDLPVYFMHQSGHLGVASSKALALAGITADTPDPPGGRIRRKKGSKEPDGVLEETAHHLAIEKLIAARVGPKESQALIDAGQRLYIKYGFTTAQDGATDPANVHGFMAAAEAGRLMIDVVSYPLLALVGDEAFMSGPYYGRTFHGHFRIGGVKIILDGSPQGKTAWLTRPYLKPPPGQPADYRGYPTMTDAFRNWSSAASPFVCASSCQPFWNARPTAAFACAVADASKKFPGTDRRPGRCASGRTPGTRLALSFDRAGRRAPSARGSRPIGVIGIAIRSSVRSAPRTSRRRAGPCSGE
jgi:predicted amidohydrolase YtcJ